MGAAAAARPSPRGAALDEVGAAEGADWEGSVTATVDDRARELDAFAALLWTAEAADEAGDLLGVSLLLAPLSNASNSSSSKLVKASTSRCEGKDMTKLMSRRLQFGCRWQSVILKQDWGFGHFQSLNSLQNLRYVERQLSTTAQLNLQIFFHAAACGGRGLRLRRLVAHPQRGTNRLIISSHSKGYTHTVHTQSAKIQFYYALMF
jgi:hypothetical protein